MLLERISPTLSIDSLRLPFPPLEGKTTERPRKLIREALDAGSVTVLEPERSRTRRADAPSGPNGPGSSVRSPSGLGGLT